MIATVHAIEGGRGGAVRAGTRPVKLADVDGLRWAERTVMAPLAMKGPPPLQRVGLLAFWDDEDSIDRFVESHPVGQRFAGGFHLRLRPLRAFGAWPGLPVDTPTTRAVPHEGPVVVMTLARPRVPQIVRFLRASRPAEAAAVADQGMLWGTAAARLPFLATVSIWRDSQASAAYAYGTQRPQHNDAIEEGKRKEFHRQSAFIRFAPIRIEGELSKKNPVSASMVTVPSG